MSRFFTFTVKLLFIAQTALAGGDKKITYQDDIQPILRQHCFACHNVDDSNSDLALDSFDGALQGGASGEVLTAGNPGASRLWKLINHEEEPSMPPDDKLPDENLALIRLWIEGGLLQTKESKPIVSSQPSLGTMILPDQALPVGKPTMPMGLYQEPLLWAEKSGAIDALATSRWAPLVAIAWQRQVSFYHSETHKLLGVLPYLHGTPKVVRFSPDGSLLLVAGGRHGALGTASLYDVESGALVTTVGDELDIVLAADINPDLSLLAIGGPRKKVRVYRTGDGALSYQLEKHTDWITALAFSPDGKLLATGDRAGGAHMWQAAAGHERADLRGHQLSITSMDWRSDSQALATASEDKTVRLWNQDGKQTKSINTHGAGAIAVRFAKDGRFVTTGRDRKVKIWQADGAAITDVCELPSIGLAADFTHDGKYIVAADLSGVVQLVNLENKKTVAALSPNPLMLAQRLSVIEATIQARKGEVAMAKSGLAKAQTSLNKGRTAHDTHQQNLAAAQTSLSESEQRYTDGMEMHENLEEVFASADKLAREATESLIASTLALEPAKENSTSDKEKEDIAHGQIDASQLLTQAQLTRDAAVESARQAKEALELATKKMAVDEKGIENAKSALELVENETQGLADLEELAIALTQAESELELRQQQLTASLTGQIMLLKHKKEFLQASDRLQAGVLQTNAQKKVVQQQATKLTTEHTAAAEMLATKQAKVAKAQAKLKALEAELASLESDQKTIQVEVERQFQELTNIRQELNTAQRAASLAESRLTGFDEAQQLRKSYLPAK